MSRRLLLTLTLLLAAPLSLLYALSHGSLAISPAELWQTLRGSDAGLVGSVILELPLPRAM